MLTSTYQSSSLHLAPSWTAHLTFLILWFSPIVCSKIWNKWGMKWSDRIIAVTLIYLFFWSCCPSTLEYLSFSSCLFYRSFYPVYFSISLFGYKADPLHELRKTWRRRMSQSLQEQWIKLPWVHQLLQASQRNRKNFFEKWFYCQPERVLWVTKEFLFCSDRVLRFQLTLYFFLCLMHIWLFSCIDHPFHLALSMAFLFL